MEIPNSYGAFFEKVREVYSWMEDDQSRRIFEARFAWSGTESDWSVKQLLEQSCDLVKVALAEVGQSYLDLPEIIETPVVIYGAGIGGNFIYDKIFKRCQDKIIFMDRNASEIIRFCNSDVISPENISSVSDKTIFFLCTSRAIVQVRTFLLDSGIKKENIYLGSEGDIWNQYFDPIITFQDGEVFADIGAFDGQTTKEFINRCPTYEKAYCFEPEKSNISMLVSNLSDETKIEIFNLGL